MLALRPGGDGVDLPAARWHAAGVAFQTTRWSLVLRAAHADADGAAALAELCAADWPPVYAFYRRSGIAADRAADLTQGLFADLLERGGLPAADPQRGSYRAYLRACARHWLANRQDHDAAQKRGGGVRVVSLDCDAEERRLRREPVATEGPEQAFERRWAQSLIEAALAGLEADERAAGRGALFGLLRPVLDSGAPSRPWRQLAAELDTTEGALRVAAHRLRTRFRERLCAEVRETLPPDAPAGDELSELLRALSGTGGRGISGPGV